MSPRDQNSSQQPERNKRKLKFYIYLITGIIIFTAVGASAITVVVLQKLGLITGNGLPSPSPTIPSIAVPSPTVTPSPIPSETPTPTISPTPSPSPTPTPLSTQTFVDERNHVTWDLTSCTRKNNVICNFVLKTSLPEIDYTVHLNSNTEIMDSSNMQYFAIKASVLNQPAGASNSLQFKMAEGGTTNLSIEYQGIPPSVNQAILLKVSSSSNYNNSQISFKDVPIN
jgi:hypothetical protein